MTENKPTEKTPLVGGEQGFYFYKRTASQVSAHLKAQASRRRFDCCCWRALHAHFRTD
jgi:hypothetical protein